ncbi:MAG TPA: hypothetical protein VGR45_18990, partial [Stellaceae bacterium]|nr:hypothetical protein [Stellaceae bacterium]
ENQKTDWRLEIIEFQRGRENEAAHAASVRVRAVVVIVAAPQIPNPQTIPQMCGGCRKASDRRGVFLSAPTGRLRDYAGMRTGNDRMP